MFPGQFRPGLDAWPGGPPVAALAALGLTAGAQYQPMAAKSQYTPEQLAERRRAVAGARHEQMEPRIAAATDPVERLLLAAALCVRFETRSLGPAGLIQWDAQQLEVSFPDLAANGLPEPGVGAWDDAEILDWFLDHVVVPPTAPRLRIHYQHGLLRRWRTEEYPGWLLRYGSLLEQEPRDGVRHHRSLAILATGSVVAVNDGAHTTDPFSVGPTLVGDGLNAIALSEIASLCGVGSSPPGSPA